MLSKKKELEKKEKKKLDRIRFVRIMEARRKEPLFLRQAGKGESRWLKQGWKAQPDSK